MEKKSMRGKSKIAFIHGIINVILPVLVVFFIHSGMLGTGEDAWKLIWLAVAMLIIPIISPLVGVIIASIQLRKFPEAKTKAGLLLSCVGLLEHIIFQFVLKL